MGTWAKEYIKFQLRDSTTGNPDTGSHTVYLQPVNQTYPTGAISCSQLSGDSSIWSPDSDLDDELDYWIYIDGNKHRRLMSLDYTKADSFEWHVGGASYWKGGTLTPQFGVRPTAVNATIYCGITIPNVLFYRDVVLDTINVN